LQKAHVELHYQDEQKKNWGSGGISNAEGVVQVFTYGKWEGAPVGLFKVTVTKHLVEGPENREVTYTLVDEKFTELAATPLELEIKGKTSQTFDVGTAIKKKIPN
jgi:hypothetical protein